MPELKPCPFCGEELSEFPAVMTVKPVRTEEYLIAKIPTVLFYDGEDFYMDGTIYQVTHWQPLPEPPKGD